MVKKVAVAVIHGMGSQGNKEPDATDDLKFSDGLRKKVRGRMGAARFDADIAWREIFWADILQKRQEKYLRNNKGRIHMGTGRSFVMHKLADAAGYRKTPDDDNDNTYTLVHERVTTTINDLESDVEEGAPLVVLAHSLGGHIMSNYIYDTIKPDLDGNPRTEFPTKFRNLETLAAFVTFGCNIPIFTFAYEEDDIWPIWYPGISIPEADRLKTWWWNYYDKDDVLGYPLSKLSPHYIALSQQGGLKDKPINSGHIFQSWNPWSHNGYWKDVDFFEPVAKLLQKV